VSPVDRIISALEARQLAVTGNEARGWTAQCPAHADRQPSLSISIGDSGTVLLHCHARCDIEAIVQALGLELRDLFDDRKPGASDGAATCGRRPQVVESYDYTDEDGTLLYQVVRRSDKSFPQRRPDGSGGWTWGLGDTRRVPYRLPQLIAGVKDGKVVYVPEGEKDVSALARLGLVATCNSGGAGCWRSEHAELFRNAKVAIIADKDAPGRKQALDIARSLDGIAAVIRIGQAAEGKDVSDHLAAGLGLDELIPVSREDLEASLPPTQSEAATDAGATSSLVPFSEIIAKPVRWAWQDRIALAKITALAGKPKIGKGLLYSRLIADVTRGALDGDLNGPRDAIIVTTEDDPGDTLKPRLMAADADLNRVGNFHMGSRDEPVPFRVPHDSDELRRRVRERNVALVVIDPLMEFIDGKVDSHRSQPVRQAIASLNSIARDTGCAILVVFHLNKGNSTDPLLRHEGSAAFTQVVRGGMLLGHDPDDPDAESGSRRVLAVTSSNLAKLAPSLAYEIVSATVVGDTGEPIATAAIKLTGESAASGYDLLKQHREDDGEAFAEDDAGGFLVNELTAGPRAAKELEREAKGIGISQRTLERARAKLRQGGVIDCSKTAFDGGWEWFLRSPPNPLGGVRDRAVGGVRETPVDIGDSGDRGHEVRHCVDIGGLRGQGGSIEPDEPDPDTPDSNDHDPLATPDDEAFLERVQRSIGCDE
jgi:hypothetical protein